MTSSSSSEEGSGDEELSVTYVCKKCGNDIGAEEREEHRQFHRDEKAKQKKRRKSKRQRDVSPSVRSSVTQNLFFVKNKKKTPTAIRKKNARKAVKNYQKSAEVEMGNRNKGA